ncbi:MAG TPA: nuclear transport factor 2 family protein [Roseiflexaceae bacterium]|nr:nuclear transport factor 2 family protein [Roseiflexaceae bacterium]
MDSLDSTQVVEGWLAAANSQDIDRLLAFSAPDILLAGPRGGGRGHELLRDWMGRAGVQLQTRRLFARGEHVVVEQHGVWRSPETGTVLGEADVASHFLVARGLVAQYARYDDFASALQAAGLTEADERSV